MKGIFRKRREQHHCRLAQEDDSDTGLPKCDPSAGQCRHWIRKFRKLFLVSFRNTQTHFYIRSRPALVAERRRHCRSLSWFVIHPLSLFAFYRLIFMTIVWLICSFGTSFMVSFGYIYLNYWCMFETVFILDIPINFIHGYIDPRTQEIVINMRSIVKRYLCGFFIPDLLSIIPLSICMTTFNIWLPDELTFPIDFCGSYAIVQVFFRIFRSVQAIDNLGNAANYLGCSKFFTIVFRILLETLYILHFTTCLLYALAEYLTTDMGYRTTLLQESSLFLESSLHIKYGTFLLQNCCLFFRSCDGFLTVKTMEERLLCTIIMLTGLFHFMHVVVQVYDVVNVYTAIGNKFEDVERQLNEYMVQKQLPRHLRKRISIYYHHRFEKKYFRESVILDTLTEHLRYEIVLFTCMPLVEKAHFFKRLPRHLIGQLMASFSREVFLHNDVVFKYGDTPTKVYFIYLGCVALYSAEGTEYYHYEDGDNFGEGPILLGGQRTYSAVSTEITETYTLTYHALRRYLRPYPQFWSKMKSNAQRKTGRATAELEKLKRGNQSLNTTEIKDTLEYL